jgi:hypothetical protein
MQKLSFTAKEVLILHRKYGVLGSVPKLDKESNTVSVELKKCSVCGALMGPLSCKCGQCGAVYEDFMPYTLRTSIKRIVNDSFGKPAKNYIDDYYGNTRDERRRELINLLEEDVIKDNDLIFAVSSTVL